MTRLSADTPIIHPDCAITDSSFGAYVEIGKGSRVAHSSFGDYSYCDRYADIANAQIGLTTRVPSDGLVASGGTDLFLAGVNRLLDPGACVGVHSWAAEEFTATDLPRSDPEHDRYLDYYADIDIDPEFYFFTLQAAPAEGMHWMTSNEVARFGLSTHRAPSMATGAICDDR